MNKLVHFFWCGGPMSWLRYLSLFTFKEQNPRHEVYMWTSNSYIKETSWDTPENKEIYSGKDWFKEACAICDKVKKYKTSPLHPIHINDIVRIHALKKYGGVWSDTDILYYKPLPYVNNFHCYFRTNRVGLIGTKKESQIYIDLFDDIPINPTGYQEIGCCLFDKYKDKLKSESTSIPMSDVYWIEWDMVHQIYNKTLNIPIDSIGLHWYGGHKDSKKFEKKVTQDNFIKYKNTIKKVIERCIV